MTDLDNKSEVYEVFCKFEVVRLFAPNDKAAYTSEFVLPLDKIHKNDDVDIIALASAYDWFQLIMSEVKSDSNKIKHSHFSLKVDRNGTSEKLFEWNDGSVYNIREAVEKAISTGFQPA
jgi:hypothetical protein